MKNLKAILSVPAEHLKDIDFSRKEKVHDWRNYVGEFEFCWQELTPRERQIIFVLADERAGQEEWD